MSSTQSSSPVRYSGCDLDFAELIQEIGMGVLKAVIQTGGLGTFLAPCSAVLPKALMPIGEGTLVDQFGDGVKHGITTMSKFGPLVPSYCGAGRLWARDRVHHRGRAARRHRTALRAPRPHRRPPLRLELGRHHRHRPRGRACGVHGPDGPGHRHHHLATGERCECRVLREVSEVTKVQTRPHDLWPRCRTDRAFQSRIADVAYPRSGTLGGAR